MASRFNRKSTAALLASVTIVGASGVAGATSITDTAASPTPHSGTPAQQPTENTPQLTDPTTPTVDPSTPAPSPNIDPTETASPTLTPDVPAPVFNVVTLADVQAGSDVYVQLVNAGTTFTGDLPQGVTLVNGLLSGTPTVAGSHTFNVVATNADNKIAEMSFTLNVTPAPTPTPSVDPTETASPTPTETVEPTYEVTPTPQPTVEPTRSTQPTVAPTPTQSATPTSSASATPSATPTSEPQDGLKNAKTPQVKDANSNPQVTMPATGSVNVSFGYTLSGFTPSTTATFTAYNTTTGQNIGPLNRVINSSGNASATGTLTTAGVWYYVFTDAGDQKQASAYINIGGATPLNPQAIVLPDANLNDIANSSVSGFSPNETVNGVWTAPDGTTTYNVSCTANGSGACSSMSPQPTFNAVGDWTFTATGVSSGYTSTAETTVVYAGDADFTMSPSIISGKGTTQISGSGFAPDDTVTCSLDNAGTSVPLPLGQGAADAQGAFAAFTSALIDVPVGTYSVTCVGVSDPSRTFTSDLTVIAAVAPEITSPVNGAPDVPKATSISGTCDVADGDVSIVIDGGTPVTTSCNPDGSFTLPHTFTTSGAHTAQVSQNGVSGNTVHFTVASDPLTPVVYPAGPVEQGEVTSLMGSGFLPSTPITCSVNGVTIGSGTSDQNGGFNFNSSAINLPVGPHQFSCTDGTNSSGNTLTVIGSPVIDPVVYPAGPVQKGESTNLHGSGFFADGDITCTVNGTVIGTGKADHNGTFSFASNAINLDAGSYDVSCTDGTRTAGNKLTVTGAPVVNPVVYPAGPVKKGETTNLYGSGFLADTNVTCTVNGAVVGSGKSDVNGAFNFASNAITLDAGSYDMSCTDGTRTAGNKLTVTGAPTPGPTPDPTPTPTPPGPTPDPTPNPGPNPGPNPQPNPGPNPAPAPFPDNGGNNSGGTNGGGNNGNGNWEWNTGGINWNGNSNESVQWFQYEGTNGAYTVSVPGFVPGSVVTINLYDAFGNVIASQTVTADADGVAHATFTDLNEGVYKVEAHGVNAEGQQITQTEKLAIGTTNGAEVYALNNAPSSKATTGVTSEHNTPAEVAKGAHAETKHAGENQDAKKQEGVLANTGVSNETAGAVLAASGLAAVAGGASIMVARRNKKA